jgi:hypothetical protein
MMKLRVPEDRVHFLLDLGRIDLLESVDDLPQELFELWIKRRRPMVRRLVNFRRSNLSKSSWRQSRWKHLLGIKKFHRSVRGKRFHRAMGRFLATRIFRDKLPKLQKRFESLDTLQIDFLKACSSIRTHLFIEGDYYQPLEEEADLFQLLEYAIPVLNSIELKVFQDSNENLDDDELELLYRLVDEQEMKKSISEVLDLPITTVSEKYQAILSRANKAKENRDDTYFMTRIMEKVVNSVSLEVSKG